MTDERYDHAAIVRGWLHEPVELASLDRQRLESALDEAAQGHSWLARSGVGRSGGISRLLGYAAAAATFVFVGGVLLMSVALLRPDDAVPPMIGTSPTPSAEASVGATEATPAASPDPTFEPFSGSTIIVAQDGSGDHETISDAIAAATDGDTIRVRPGRYDEVLTIDKNVAIVGDGPREDIIVEPTGGVARATRLEWGPPTVHIDGAAVRLADLTILDERGDVRHQAGVPGQVYTDGSAAPILERLDADSIRIGEASSATVRDNDVREISVIAATAPIIESNRVEDIIIDSEYDYADWGDETAGATVRDNAVEGLIIVSSLGQATSIEGNQTPAIIDLGVGSTIVDNQVGSIDLAGSDTLVRDNAVDGAYGIVVQPVARDVVVEGNIIDADRLGLAVGGDGPTMLRDNSITGGQIGMLLATTALEMDGNTVCDNEEDVRLLPGVAFDAAGKGFCDPEPGVAGLPEAGSPDADLEPDEDGLVFRELQPGVRQLIYDGAGHYPSARWVFGSPAMFPIESTPDGRIKVVQELPEVIDESELGSHLGILSTTIEDVRIGPLGVVDAGTEAWIIGEPGTVANQGADGTNRLWARATRAIGRDGSGVLEILERRGARPDGLLWAEVRTRGGWRAARFDGERWTVFPRAPGPRARQRIEDGPIDSNGNLWFGNDDGTGFVVFDGDTYRTFPISFDDTGEKAFDAAGNLWVGLDDPDDTEDDRAIGLVRIDASLIEGYGVRRGDAELAARFPISIAGTQLEITTLSGPEYVQRFIRLDPSMINPVASPVERYLGGTGRTVDELSVGYTMFEPRPDNRAFITAVRVRGTDGADLTEAVIPLMLGDIDEPMSERIEIAGKDIDRLTDTTMPGMYPKYLYPAGDVVWIIDAEEPVLSEIVRALP